MIRANVSFDHVGDPSSLRAWMWTIAAPASYARRASSAISTGVYGMAGQCFLVVTAPVSAHDRMTLSEELMVGGTIAPPGEAVNPGLLSPAISACQALRMHRFALVSLAALGGCGGA